MDWKIGRESPLQPEFSLGPFPSPPTCDCWVEIESLHFGGQVKNGLNGIALLRFGFSQDGFLSSLTGILMSAMSLMLLSSLGNLFFGSFWLFQVRFAYTSAAAIYLAFLFLA